MICPLSCISTENVWAEGEYICFYFPTRVQRGASTGECPMFLNKLMMGQSK
jgi:hypothetical protein